MSRKEKGRELEFVKGEVEVSKENKMGVGSREKTKDCDSFFIKNKGS